MPDYMAVFIFSSGVQLPSNGCFLMETGLSEELKWEEIGGWRFTGLWIARACVMRLAKVESWYISCFLILIMYMWVSALDCSVHRGIRSPGAGVLGNCETPLRVVTESNSGPLQEPLMSLSYHSVIALDFCLKYPPKTYVLTAWSSVYSTDGRW